MTDRASIMRGVAHARTPAARARLLRLAKIARVREQIASCTGCALSRTRTQTVPMTSVLNPELVVVGEAPGEHEDRTGVPFAGRAGHELDRCLLEADTHRDNVVLLNILCCRPPGNRDPLPEERLACQPNLQNQLEQAQATVGVLVGKVPLLAVHGADAPRGRPFWQEGRVWIPTWHPAYILRNPAKRPELVADLKMAVGLARGTFLYPTAKADDLTLEGVGDIGPRLTDPGWVHIFSHRLEAEVVVARDRSVEIPPPDAELPRYTLQELLALGIMGRRRTIPLDELRAVHTAKVAFKGTITVSPKKVTVGQARP